MSLRHLAVASLVACCLLALRQPTASAQITAQEVLGAAVTKVGPEFAPVGQAIEAMKNGQAGEARKLLTDLQEKQTQLPPADVMFAKLLIAFKQTTAARAALEQAVATSPKDPEAFLMLGNYALGQREATYAQLCFSYAGLLLGEYDRNLARKEDMTLRMHAGKAAVAEERREWDEARKQLIAWLELDKKAVEAHRRLANVLFQLKEYDLAKQSLTAAYELDNSLLRPEVNLALLYEKDGLSDKARTMLENSVKQHANEMSTLLAVANWALRTGNLDLAASTATTASKLDAESVPAMLVAAQVARIRKDLPAAEKFLLAAHVSAPSNFAASNQLALVLQEQTGETKHRQALEYAQLNARVHPDRRTPAGREAAVTLAWLLFRQGRELQGEQLLKSILNAGPLSNESAYYAARMFNDRGNSEAAKAILESTLQGDLSFPHRAEADDLLKKLSK